jgi:outer membrane protein assembly factor BamB
VAKSNDGNITPEEASEAVSFSLYSGEYEHYLINAGFGKQQVFVRKVGKLTYGQAFCIYDGKYYSINGQNIAVQDASFTLVEDKALAVGHGNSLQLGHSGKAYASGWNDNKVYVVDLPTLSVESVINLPTTGYTTAAIDDINKIAYIFQRGSFPNTEAIYNFIVYDYENENIISTKKIPKAFGAMQSCDFIDGRIFVLNGDAGNGVPNGYRVYNTNGDIISELRLGRPYSTNEPEGVFVDRDTMEIFISFANLFAITFWPT